MPYFAYTTCLHLYETMGWWRTAELRRVHFAEAGAATFYSALRFSLLLSCPVLSSPTHSVLFSFLISYPLLSAPLLSSPLLSSPPVSSPHFLFASLAILHMMDPTMIRRIQWHHMTRRALSARHFAQEWNELHHLLIMEAMGGDKRWRDRFLAGYYTSPLVWST